jgi:hypothetical protein
MVDEIVVGCEDAIGEPVVAHELPDVFLGVEFGAFRRQGDEGDVGRHGETGRHVPAGLIDQEHGVGARRHGFGDLDEMQVHRFGIAGGQDQGCALAFLRTDRAEDVGGGGALIAGRARTGAALGPSACDLVLLADARLVLEPNLYCADVDRLVVRDVIQARGKVFLKSSIAPLAWAWWRGRAESLR